MSLDREQLEQKELYLDNLNSLLSVVCLDKDEREELLGDETVEETIERVAYEFGRDTSDVRYTSYITQAERDLIEKIDATLVHIALRPASRLSAYRTVLEAYICELWRAYEKTVADLAELDEKEKQDNRRAKLRLVV